MIHVSSRQGIPARHNVVTGPQEGQFPARLRSRFACRQLRLQVKRPNMKIGQWCWRVTVRFEDGDAYDVDLTDYQ